MASQSGGTLSSPAKQGRRWSIRIGKGRSKSGEEASSVSVPEAHQPPSDLSVPLNVANCSDTGSWSEAPCSPNASEPLTSPLARTGAKLRSIRRKFRRKRGEGGEAEERPGLPPSGYLWVYIGRWQRWKQRFFVAAPGALHYFTSASRRGARWTISLRRASVILTGRMRRQFVIVSGSSLIYCRALQPEQRQQWMDCIQVAAVWEGRGQGKEGVVGGKWEDREGGERAERAKALLWYSFFLLKSLPRALLIP